MEKIQPKRGLRSGFPGLDLLHLFSLSSTAFAAPLFFVLGAQAEFFVARRSPPGDVIAFTVIMTFLPALVLAVVETLVWLLSPSLQKRLHGAFVGALATLICLAFFPLGLPLSVLLGVLFGVAYHRSEGTRGFCTRLSLVGLVLPLAFLLGTPVSTLIRGGRYKSDVRVTSTIPVVLLVFDELPLSSMLNPKLEVDAKSFPNFARFQADALWFRNAAAAADDTMRAVPAILTGKRAPRDKPPVLGNYPENIFTLLAGSYRLAVSENLTALAPAGEIDNVDVSTKDRWRVLASDTVILYLHRVLPAAYTTDLPPIDKGWVDFGNELKRPPREQGFLNFLSQLNDPAEPVLYYYHSNFPHYPYSFLPDGREYDSGAEAGVDGLDGNWMWLSPWQSVLGYQRHLLQARFADRLLGQALDRMQEVGLYQRALVIVVADHGASYRFGAPFRPAAPGSLPGVGPVPIMVKLPGADHPKGIVDRPVTTLDVLPTIIDVLDISTAWPLEGRSLLDESASSTSRKISADVMKTGELVPFPDDLGPLRDAVGHRSRIFGPSLEGLFKVGPAARLIGQPMPVGKTSTLKAVLLWPSLLLDFKPTERFVPCRLRGFIGYEGPSIALAIALNGRIAGSTFSVPGVGKSSFSLIVDPGLLQPGRNEVSLAVMKTDGTFEQLELEGQRAYQLQGNQICDDKGQPLPKEDALDGMVMGMVLEEGGYKVEGWSALGVGGSGVPPKELVIFQDGRFLLAAPPQPDGTFRLGLPKPVLVSDRRVRVFAVGGKGARELSYQDSYRQRAKLR